MNTRILKEELLESEVFDCLKERIKSVIPKSIDFSEKAPKKYRRRAVSRTLFVRIPYTGINKSKYHKYIKSKEWGIKKKKMYSIFGYRCMACHETNKRKLHVHHATYARLFEEKVKDLYILCNDCHKEFHSTKPKNIIRNTIKFIISKGGYRSPRQKKEVKISYSDYVEDHS